MKSITSDFKIAITEPRRIDTKIIVDENNIIPIDEINNVTRTFYAPIFGTVMKSLVIDANNLIEKNKMINPYFGLYINNNNFEYVSLDNFKVRTLEKNEDTLSYEIKAEDKIIESMIEYDLQVEYPISVRNYWIAIFNRLGWDLSGIPETFINSNKMINQDVHSNIKYSFRTVLDELCTISCAFLIDKNGIPTITYPTETDVIIDEEYMKEDNIKIKGKVFFNSLVFSRAEESDNIFRKDDESITNYGLHEFRIIDNQLLSTNDRADFIEDMWDYLKTFEYYAFDIETRGITFLEPLDKFQIKIKSSLYPTILLNDELQFCDGVSEILYSDFSDNIKTDYEAADSTDKRFNQTYILVDKQKQRINAIVNEQSNQSSKLSQLEINNTSIVEQVSNINNAVDEITGQVSEIENTVQETITSSNAQFEVINKTLSDGVEKLKNNLVTIDINGINVSTNIDNFKALLSNKSVLISDSGKEIAFFGYDDILKKTIARIKELETEKITAGYHRCEGFQDGLEKRTGWFWVGGN